MFVFIVHCISRLHTKAGDVSPFIPTNKATFHDACMAIFSHQSASLMNTLVTVTYSTECCLIGYLRPAHGKRGMEREASVAHLPTRQGKTAFPEDKLAEGRRVGKIFQ